MGLILLILVWLTVASMVFNGELLQDDKNSATTAQTKQHPSLRNHIQDTFENDPPPASSSSNSSSTGIIPTSTLLSRDSSIKVTADVRGNLGPASVIIQQNPGKDWIKDRWQAAGDMHGTAIPGQHWVILDFGENKSIHVDKVVLDWEAAYAKNYRIEGSMDDIHTTKGDADADEPSEWCILYNGKDETQESQRIVEEYGQSPGVKQRTPLHVVHTIDLEQVEDCPMRFLRVFIEKPARGWGVSLWQLDVYGWYN